MLKYPIIKISIAYLIGILFTEFLNLDLYFLLILTLIFLGSIFFIQKIQAQNKLISVVLLVLIIILSFINAKINIPEKATYPFIKPKNKSQEITVEVIGKRLEVENKLQIEAQLIGLNGKRIEKKRQKKFLINFWKDKKQTQNNLEERIGINDTLNFIGSIEIGKNILNYGDFDYQNYLNENNLSGIINCSARAKIKIWESKNFSIEEKIFSVRNKFDKYLHRIFKPKAANFLRGIFLGERNAINYSQKKFMNNAGVIHILAVSGLHVGIIALIVYFVFFLLPLKIRGILTILLLAVFLMITGFPISAVRAVLMTSLFIIVKITNRSDNILNILFATALLILLFSPAQFFEIGFQMSFAAVLSLVIIYPVFEKKINFGNINLILKYFIKIFLASFSIQLGTLPLILLHFKEVSIIAPVVNVFIIPLLVILISLAILVILLSPVTIFFTGFVNILVEFIFNLINLFGSQSFATLQFHHLNNWGIFFITVLVSALIFLFKEKHSPRFYFYFLILFVTNIYLIQKVCTVNKFYKYPFSLLMLDVGQGDSFLIKFPNNKIALIDAGNKSRFFDAGCRSILPTLDFFDIKKINYVFISHMDADHYKGLFSLVGKIGIDSIFVTPTIIADKNYSRLNAEFSQSQFISIEPKPMKIGNVRIYSLKGERKFRSKNNNSMILKIVFNECSFLFCGDAEFLRENELCEIYSDFLEADILKVSHHGSKTATSQRFLNFTNSRKALISAGKNNRFGHPSNEVISRLKRNKIKIYRTDFGGAFLFGSDGKEILNLN